MKKYLEDRKKQRQNSKGSDATTEQQVAKTAKTDVKESKPKAGVQAKGKEPKKNKTNSEEIKPKEKTRENPQSGEGMRTVHRNQETGKSAKQKEAEDPLEQDVDPEVLKERKQRAHAMYMKYWRSLKSF